MLALVERGSCSQRSLIHDARSMVPQSRCLTCARRHRSCDKLTSSAFSVHPGHSTPGYFFAPGEGFGGDLLSLRVGEGSSCRPDSQAKRLSAKASGVGNMSWNQRMPLSSFRRHSRLAWLPIVLAALALSASPVG